MTTVSFSFTGAVQSWVVPTGVSEVTVETWGAQGGSSTLATGGKGGYAKGNLAVTAGETLNIYVGGAGGAASTGGAGGAGGWNGGGSGVQFGGGGGGASDLRQGGTALSARKIVGAGGGGVGASYNSNAGGAGGAGGAATGGAGGDGYLGTNKGGGGGTQSAGGAGGAGGSVNGSAGTAGSGGAGANSDADGGGGGGGFYGGGGGGGSVSRSGGGGGGGSNYVTGLSDTFSSGGTRSGDGLVKITYADNTAPNAPTLTSPASGATVDRTVTQRFSWDFSDPNAGDTQSKYELRYRPTSTTTWTTVSGTTPNTYHDFASGTFVAGDHEWQVRTWDAAGAVGPWSGSAFFTAATPPAGPTITDPTSGQTIPTEVYTVAWSIPDQDAYQLRRVADSAGTADTTTVYFDTGTISSSGARSRPVEFETNGRWEHVQIRVQESGLWSGWVSVRVQVSYTVPATPTVQVDASSTPGAIMVQATHPTPTGAEPTVTSVDVWRRVTSEGGDGIRVAAGLAPTELFTDWAVASGVEYGYRVRAYGDNGTSSWSGWSEEPSEFVVYYGGSYS